MNVFGWDVTRATCAVAASLLAVAAASALRYLFFRTDLGTAMRATGDNPQMIRALGVNVDR